MFGRRTSGHYLPKVIVSAACDKITVSHIKHFKTEPRKIAALRAAFRSRRIRVLHVFRLLYLPLDERRHLAKPFKNHYSFAFLVNFEVIEYS